MNRAAMLPMWQSAWPRNWRLVAAITRSVGQSHLGYWAEPRGTLDVDFTLFIAPDKPGECVWLLRELGCEFSTSDALRSLNEHGFCRVSYAGLQGPAFDRDWVRERLSAIYGRRDPRISQWDDLVAEGDTATD